MALTYTAARLRRCLADYRYLPAGEQAMTRVLVDRGYSHIFSLAPVRETPWLDGVTRLFESEALLLDTVSVVEELGFAPPFCHTYSVPLGVWWGKSSTMRTKDVVYSRLRIESSKDFRAMALGFSCMPALLAREGEAKPFQSSLVTARVEEAVEYMVECLRIANMKGHGWRTA